MSVEEIVAVAYAVNKRNKKRKAHWIQPLIAKRSLSGHFHSLYEELRAHPKKFFEYFRMTLNSFDELLVLVRPKISKHDTNMRRAISPEQRLCLTIRYLSTGCCFKDLHIEFLIGISTIHCIISETCIAIWDCLKISYMPEKSTNDWIKISKEFEQRTNFPNALGAIDVKQIEIKPNATHCVILTAVADANYCFTCIDVGAYEGSSYSSDSNVFKNTTLFKKMEDGELNLPPDGPLPKVSDKKPMPFVFIGDEAFALSEKILRPYPNRNLNEMQFVFNYRLSRARRMVESSLGILTHKWRILNRALDLKTETILNVVKACCVLHNYVIQKDGFEFEESLYGSLLDNIPSIGVRGNNKGVQIRDYFMNYFISTEGAVPWQNQIVMARPP